MRPPVLARALVLETAQPIPDGAGGHQLHWQPLGTLWAKVVAQSGRDLAGEERQLSRIAWRITLRAAPPGSPLRPSPDQRLREGSRIFTILAVAECGPLGRYLTCSCREEVPT